MARNSLTILAAVITSCCACLAITWALQPRTGVAVVDLDEVSRQLGRNQEMQQSIKQKTEAAQQRLEFLEKDAVAQLEEARRAIGATPSQEDSQKFQQMRQSATVQLNQLKQRAEQEVSGHRQQLVTQFRDQARPVVAQVAKKHGFGTVITRNDAFLFSFEKTVDITDEVAQLMASSAPATAAAPQPKAAPAPEKAAAPAEKSAVEQVKHETR
ncbi:OmpH family outer membrane protein [Planctomicrobium sp. SH661]|uniref:OmpH family outer membrane protein n=1 Tax=Planctomicrobium sp. SH661 TaxID=3448124 RepID=UPI003F5BC266